MTSNHPLFFSSLAIPRVWGGRAFEELLGHSLSTAEPYGEIWDICDLPPYNSRVTEGPHQGKTLGELWQTNQPDLTAKTSMNRRAFPLLVKWLDCRDWLSVQVHPDDLMARELLRQDYGKPEIWVVLKAESTARIYAGLRPDISRDLFLRQLEVGAVEECLHSFTPRSGDCIVLPAGTVHSAGGGLLMAEIQQSSDTTFRLFDWNRLGFDGQPRSLQTDLALQAIDWNQGPIFPVVPHLMTPCQDGVRIELLSKQYPFRLERYTFTVPWVPTDQSELAIWMVLDGQAILTECATGESRHVTRGRSVLVPATTEISWSTPECGSATVLRVRLPIDDGSEDGHSDGCSDLLISSGSSSSSRIYK